MGSWQALCRKTIGKITVLKFLFLQFGAKKVVEHRDFAKS